MTEPRHRRGKSVSHFQVSTDLGDDFEGKKEEKSSHLRLGSTASTVQLRGILKNAAKPPKPEAPLRKLKEGPSRDSGPPSFSLSRIHEESALSIESVETLISAIPDSSQKLEGKGLTQPRFSPRTRYAQDVDWTTPIDEKVSDVPSTPDPGLLAAVGKAIKSIKSDLAEAAQSRAEARKELLTKTLYLIQDMKTPGNDKDVSLVVLETDEDSGSETERGTIGNNRAAMKLAVKQYASDPRTQDDLLRLIDICGTPRLTMLMRKNQVEGLYRQAQGGWRKVYGSPEAPTNVDSGMITACFALKDAQLTPIAPKQLWKADAFAL